MSRSVLFMLVFHSCRCDGNWRTAAEAGMDGHGSSESSWRQDWQVAAGLNARKSRRSGSREDPGESDDLPLSATRARNQQVGRC